MIVNKAISGHVIIALSDTEVALALDAYVVAHGLHVMGPRTLLVNGKIIERGQVIVDPTGAVNTPTERIEGSSFKDTYQG